jgi:hypothetical protein
MDGSLLKVGRARRHIDEFETELAKYLDSHPFRVEWADASRSAYSVTIAREPPIQLGLIAGDIAHCLRSALDLLAWQLVWRSGAEPSRDTAFPISTSEESLERTIEWRLRGALPEAKRAVRETKPHRGGNAVLWALHELDIEDKHRVVLPLATDLAGVRLSVLRQATMTFSVPIVPVDEIRRLFGEVPAYAAHYTIVSDAAGSREPSLLEMDVCFGGDSAVAGQPMLTTLKRFADEAQSVIERIAARCFQT